VEFEYTEGFYPARKKFRYEDSDMDETITIKIAKNQKSRMITEAKRKMSEALANLDPPFNDELDKVKLDGCSAVRDGLRVIYRVIRGAACVADSSVRTGEREP
jgi:hypothetical protein